MPGGVQGADLVEIVRSSESLLASFGNHFWSKTVMFLKCFIDVFVDVMFMVVFMVFGLLFIGYDTFVSFFVKL